MTSKMGRSVHILLLLACATNAFMAPRALSARHMRSVLSAAVPDDCAVDDPRPAVGACMHALFSDGLYAFRRSPSFTFFAPTQCRDDNSFSTLDGFASQKVFNKGPLPTPVVFEVPDDCDVDDPRPEVRVHSSFVHCVHFLTPFIVCPHSAAKIGALRSAPIQ